MALITCPDCGQAVSDRAPSCPRCGYPLAPQAPPPPPPVPNQQQVVIPPQQSAVSRGFGGCLGVFLAIVFIIIGLTVLGVLLSQCGG
jgi:hypothetical protein